MNLLLREDIKNKDHLDMTLIIHAVSEDQFGAFITAMLNKQDWIAELCGCYYHIIDGQGGYLFETFEEHEFFILYEEFMKFVSLAVVRYLNNSSNEERKAQIRAIISGTMIEDIIDNAPIRDDKKVTLVYGRKN